MTNKYTKLAVTFLACGAFYLQSFAADGNKQYADSVSVVASKDVPVNFAGSVSKVSKEQLARDQYTDVNRILKNLPGVNIREEDGFGLRPNIGIRGSRSSRSANITLLEDGTLAAPAAFGNPEAYYFPEPSRMESFEVFKGGSVVKYGPRTTSGVLNMITKQIDNSSNVNVSTGSFNEKNIIAKHSVLKDNYGYLINYSNRSSDGFKKIDNSNQNTGYKSQDYMIKLRYNNDKKSYFYSQFDLKIAQNQSSSNETYLGLTKEDFDKNPLRRYAASELDRFEGTDNQAELKHTLVIDDNFTLNTKIYQSQFARSWHRLSTVNGKSLSDILLNPSQYAAELAIIKGEASTTNGSVTLKDNKRTYLSRGIQLDSSFNLQTADVKHNFEVGTRLHNDYEDKHQALDKYNITGGRLNLYQAGIYGETGKLSDNQRNSGTSFAGYIKDEIEYNKFTIAPGFRYERVSLNQKEWQDSQRTNQVLNATNVISALLPSLSASYLLNDETAIFASVNKGFAPPAPGSKADKETSTNYELGYRLQNKDKKTAIEAVAYYNDYKNLLASDGTAGGGAATGNQYNAGKVKTYGLEFVASSNRVFKGFELPTSLVYTYTMATFESSFIQNGIPECGSVAKGNKLPYVPNNQLTINNGIAKGDLSFNLSSRYVQRMNANASGTQQIPSQFVFDATLHYNINKTSQLYAGIDNITDRIYLVSLSPSGYRGGKPRTIKIGLSFATDAK